MSPYILTLMWVAAALFGTDSRGATLSGYVVDDNTGEGLSGANVYLAHTDMGMATNREGYFILPGIPPGTYTLVVSFLGFETVRTSFQLKSDDNIRRDFGLKRISIDMEQVDVTAERIKRKLNLQTSQVNLNVRQLKSVPRIGEADLLRSLQALPGVLTETEFSTGLVIRGGNSDQNLILLDGITVYNPSHVGGFFSNFLLDAVKEVDLQKGGFNAEYGGRLSAVLNVRSREGNRKHFDAKTSISLVSANATLEGPIGKGAWLASARRTYFDQIFRGTDLYFPYYFYDFQGHVFQDLTDRDRLSFSWYTGRDDLEWGEFLLLGKWGNETYSLNYRRLLNEKLLAHWLLAKSRFDILFGLGGSSGINERDFINDFTFRTDWTYFHARHVQFRFGLEVKELAFSYSAAYLDSSIFNLRQSPLEAGAFAKSKYWISPRLLVEPGLRINYYEEHPVHWYLDPRLGIKYLLTTDRYLNYSIGRYHQFMGTVQDDFNPKILDAWIGVDPSVEPASAIQTVIGYEEYIASVYRIQIEAYYKSMENMMTFVDFRSAADETVPDTSLAPWVDQSDGFAYGTELFLHKVAGRLDGWMAYSYSVSWKTLNGKRYATNWDRRHSFDMVGNYRLGEKWDFNVKWTFQTGQPHTPILGYYFQNTPGEGGAATVVPIPGDRNSVRYPPYHRLDLGANWHFRLGNSRGDLFIQVANVYWFWHKNVFRYVYSFGDTANGVDDDNDGQVDEPDEGKPQRVTIPGLPIIPSVGVTFDF